jgi:hypothetical protein
MVQRLARGPFKAEIRVRFPLALPNLGEFVERVVSASLLYDPSRETHESFLRRSHMSIAGNWKISVKTPMGDQQSTLDLEVDNNVLRGTQKTPFGVTEVTGGAVDGNTAKWKTKMTSPFEMDLEFSAVVDGDKISGTVKAGMFGESPFSGSRE